MFKSVLIVSPVRLKSAEHGGNSASDPAGWLLPVAPAMEPTEENLWSSDAVPYATFSLPSSFFPLLSDPPPRAV